MSEKKGFFAEFKTFISRGNVMDLAVGTIIGAAFSSIVTALTNGILKPIINWVLWMIFGGDSLSAMYTVLVPAYTVDDTGAQILDTAKAIFIDWGAFISAIINFLLIALVLFVIIKAYNKVKDETEKAKAVAAAKKEEAEKAE